MRLLASACLFCASQSQAQTVAPNVVVPKVPGIFGPNAPAPQTPTSPDGETPPPAETDVEVVLEAVTVSGAFDEMKEALDTLESRLKGRRLSLTEVRRAIDEYQQAYESAGFLLARVVTPSQTLADKSTLRLVVIDGFVESIETSGLPEKLRGAVTDRLAPVVGVRRLRSEVIERQLMLVANMHGVRLRSALATGTQRGGVRLIVDGTYAATFGGVQVDNRLPPALGTWETSLSVGTNQWLGRGEKLYASAVSALRSEGHGPPVRAIVAGAAAPFGINGFMANVEFSDSRSVQRGDIEVPATEGRFRRVAIRVSRPWELTRRKRLDLRASLEHVEQSVAAASFDAVFNHDNYRVLRVGGEAAALTRYGNYQLATFVSQGLGGRDAVDASESGVPLSRMGAGPRFTKADFSLQWSTDFSSDYQLSALAHGQFAGGKPLMKSEQLSLEGGTDILSFPVGTFAVDSGAATRVEASRHFAVGSMAMKASLFAAIGAGKRLQPTAVENASVRAGSLGLSLSGAASEPMAWWTPYFNIDCAQRRSNDGSAPRGWTVLATIGVKL